jgi:tetratricopeptide (TPR) repeat protein
LYFKNCDYERAVEAYTESIAKGLETGIAEENLVSIYTNRSIAYIKLSEYVKAEEDCNRALTFDPQNVKALIRRGRSKHKLQKLKDAKYDFESALKIGTPDNEILQEIEVIKRKLMTLKESSKARMVPE